MRNSRLILVHETKAIPLVVMVAIPSAFALYTVGLFATSKHLSSWVITKDSYSQFGFPQHTASASGPRPPSPRVSLDGTKANTRGPRLLLFRALATLESNKFFIHFFFDCVSCDSRCCNPEHLTKSFRRNSVCHFQTSKIEEFTDALTNNREDYITSCTYE